MGGGKGAGEESRTVQGDSVTEKVYGRAGGSVRAFGGRGARAHVVTSLSPTAVRKAYVALAASSTSTLRSRQTRLLTDDVGGRGGRENCENSSAGGSRKGRPQSRRMWRRAPGNALGDRGRQKSKRHKGDVETQEKACGMGIIGAHTCARPACSGSATRRPGACTSRSLLARRA